MDWHSAGNREQSCRWAEALLARPNWAVLDTETTGLDGRAEVIQIAIVGPDGAPILNTLVRPQRRIPADATAIHGITDSMVASAPSYSDVYPSLLDALSDRLVIAYNAEFDRRMLRQTGQLNRVPELPTQWDCAMKQYSRYVGRRSGQYGNAFVPLPRPETIRGRKHQAIDDCLATLAVIQRMAGIRNPLT